MTSQARKQAWAAAHIIAQWECTATYGWWRFSRRDSDRNIWLWVADRRAWCTSDWSRAPWGDRYPDLGGIALPLLALVPPGQYARAIAMQLKSKPQWWWQ